MSTHPDAPRIIQANDVASIVIQQATEHAPGLFVTLDLRYGIADALWAAGYRKDSEVAALTAQLQAAQREVAKTDAAFAALKRQHAASDVALIDAKTTIAEALSITVDGRGVVSALGRIRDRLSRATPSTTPKETR